MAQLCFDVFLSFGIIVYSKSFLNYFFNHLHNHHTTPCFRVLLPPSAGEIDKLEESSRMFRGVGRMFMLETKPETVGRLAAESEESKAAAATCTKEKAYLQRTYKESEESLRELLRNR